jgi:hypothetical protein
MTVSRRVTLGWIAAAASSALATAGCDERAAHTVGEAAPWKEVQLSPVTTHGYGRDPSFEHPHAPWPLTLDAQQRQSLHTAADLMLPADPHSPSGGAQHLDAFVDEWISAPYPIQQQDRALIVPGLAWLDAESTRRFGHDFRAAADAERRQIFDSIAFRKNVKPGFERPARFFARLRSLMLAGFYSLPEGIADIGYMGNSPSAGPWAGPTPEALAHLNSQLARLGLKPVKAG